MSVWQEIGTGACDGEKLMRRPVTGGYLVATVVVRKGYDAKGEVVDRGEETRAITFVPGHADAPRVLTEDGVRTSQS